MSFIRKVLLRKKLLVLSLTAMEEMNENKVKPAIGAC